MTEETLKQANMISDSLYRAEKELGWMKEWGETLKECPEDELFNQTIENRWGKVVLQRKLPRNEVVQMVKAHHEYLLNEKIMDRKQLTLF